MKILYFDCFAGISGDMILGSLLDAGLDITRLKEELSKLNLEGYEIDSEKIVSKGVSGTRCSVKISESHHHRGLKEIFSIIDNSGLSLSVKNRSKEIFQRLGEVEAKIHNKDINEIHFHEVGAIDAIVDIVGAVIGLEILGIDKIISSKIHLGTGTLECAHGVLPVPAPATLELLKNVPVYSSGIEKELVTPTGASILTTIAESYGSLPDFTVENTGFGMGTRELPIPNFLRVVIGESEVETMHDTIQLIETNIDDMNPQYYDHIIELLFNAGAKDVFLTPIIMKKNRPGVILSILASHDQVDNLSKIVFRETTTLGLRLSNLNKRRVLKRELRTINTSLGEARIKIKYINETEKVISPEYDDCKKIAKEKDIPIHLVSERIVKEAEILLNDELNN